MGKLTWVQFKTGFNLRHGLYSRKYSTWIKPLPVCAHIQDSLQVDEMTADTEMDYRNTIEKILQKFRK